MDETGIHLLDTDLMAFINNVEPCNNMCGGCKDALPNPANGGSYTKGMLGWAFWMVGNISDRRQTNTCPTNVTIQVYDSTHDGSGDCNLGFQAAVNGYTTVDGSVNWTAREY